MNISLMIREKYSLTRKSLSIITGISVNALQHYELRGDQPNKSNSLLLRSCFDPYSFKRLYDISKEGLNKSQARTISKCINALITDIEKSTQEYKETLIDTHRHVIL